MELEISEKSAVYRQEQFVPHKTPYAIFNNLKKYIEGNSFYELGSGWGSTLKYIKHNLDVTKVGGLDNRKETVDYCKRKYNFDIKCQEVKNVTHLPIFDVYYIWCGLDLNVYKRLIENVHKTGTFLISFNISSIKCNSEQNSNVIKCTGKCGERKKDKQIADELIKLYKCEYIDTEYSTTIDLEESKKTGLEYSPHTCRTSGVFRTLIFKKFTFKRSHASCKAVLNVLKQRKKGYYIRIGDGDIEIANGRTAGWQNNTGNITQEEQEALALETDSEGIVLKSFPADCRMYGVEDFIGGQPVGVEAVELQSDHQDRFVKRMQNNAKKFWKDVETDTVYSGNAFWYPACYDVPFFVDFTKQLKELTNGCIYIGNESDNQETLELLFGKLKAWVKTPPRNAYSEIDRIEKEAVHALTNDPSSDYTLVVIAMGCGGRPLGKRLWYNKAVSANCFFLDYGSLIDAFHGRSTRGWIRKETFFRDYVIAELKRLTM